MQPLRTVTTQINAAGTARGEALAGADRAVRRSITAWKKESAILTTTQIASRQRALRASISALLALAAGSCAPEAGVEPESFPELAQAANSRQTLKVTDTQGTYVADVRASGSGCLPGTWSTAVSADGQSFTTTFTSYVVQVDPGVSMSVRECQLALILRTPSVRSFSVKRLSYSGFAMLQPGLVGKQTASYYFEGAPVPADGLRTDLSGPQDAFYQHGDDVAPSDRVWSTCDVERGLNVDTRVQLENGTPRASGYMSLSAADGGTRIVVTLESRLCDTNQVSQPPSTQAAAPSEVVLDPPVVAPEQPFTVRWTPSVNAPDTTTYRVEVRAPASAGSTLLWTSPEIAGQLVAYNGPPLRPAGLYQVVVVARVGGTELRSAMAPLQVQGAPDVASSSAVPAWAQPLLGTYAVRTDTFAQSVVGPMLADRQIAIAEFVEVPGGLELRKRLCSKEATSIGLTVYIRKPSAYPEERQRVVLSNGGWSTEAAARTSGYDRAGYAGCAGRTGQRVPRRPEQIWLRPGTCMCRALTEAPTFDDCRVTDPDGDGAPGLAYKYRGTADAETWVAHSATVSRSRYTSGTIQADGSHFGALKSDEMTFQLACEPDACGLPSNVRACTSDFNGSQFRRLPAPPPGQPKWTCEMLAGRSDLLSAAMPTPSRCTRDSVTSLP